VGGSETATPLPFCVFLSWRYRANPSDAPVCDGVESFHGEGEVAASRLVLYTHTRVAFVLPEGLGKKTLRISAAGSVMASDAWRTGVDNGAGVVTVQYGAPTVTAMDPAHGSTDGGTMVEVSGSNLGPAIRDLSRSPVNFRAGVSLNAAPSIPTAFLVVRWPAACIAGSYTPEGAVPQRLRSCQFSLASVSQHSVIRLYSPPGIGLNRTVSVAVYDGPTDTLSTSSPVRWNYDPPRVDVVTPNPLLIGGVVDLDGTVARWNGPTRVTIFGSNFGDDSLADAQNWTAAERQVNMSVGTSVCLANSLTRSSQSRLPSIACDVERQEVGYKDVVVYVAGQEGVLEASESGAVLVACDQDFFALDEGQECLPCPEGAQCYGWVRETDPVVLQTRLMALDAAGKDLRYAENHMTRPDPMVGWYDMNGTASSQCPDSFRAGEAERDVCVVPCEPAWSCAGSNFCGVGYVSEEPNYRCSSCAEGYFRQAGLCVKCPDNAWLLIIFFLFLVAVAAVAAWQLNKRQISIALLTIGVDFFQLMAVFNNARISWPPIVQDLLHVLSAFNLNLDIAAPECTIPNVAYMTKWWIIEGVPLAVLLGAVASYYGIYFYKRTIQHRNRVESTRHYPQFVSMALVAFFFLYLQITKVALEPLTCVPTNPPDGHVYMTAVFEPCDRPGGIHQTLLFPALAFLLVYTIGYPILLGYTLYKQRDAIVSDQLLRALGTGSTENTNPFLAVRLSFSRVYYAFKPDYYWWTLVSLARKLGVVLASLAFATNPAMQLAVTVAIVFLTYSALVRNMPYMNPGKYGEVLEEHRRRAEKEPESIHARVGAEIAAIRAKVGERRTRTTLLDGMVGGAGGKAASPLMRYGATVAGSLLLDYNLVEQQLLFMAILILLAGMCFESAFLDNAYYSGQRDALTIITMLLIISAILYYFVSLGVEVHALMQHSSQLQASAKRAGGSGGGGGKKAEDGKDVEMSAIDLNNGVDAEAPEQTSNPMLLLSKDERNGSSTDGTASGIADAILALETPPTDQTTWEMFRDAFRTLQDESKRLREDATRARAASIAGSPTLSLNGSPDSGGALMSAATRYAFPRAGSRLSGGASPAGNLGGRRPSLRRPTPTQQ
jgi:hypothetical protein